MTEFRLPTPIRPRHRIVAPFLISLSPLFALALGSASAQTAPTSPAKEKPARSYTGVLALPSGSVSPQSPIIVLPRDNPPGHVASQAAPALGVPLLNGAYDGRGVTIAVLSNSFDNCQHCSIHAAQDIASGNLPGPGNPYGDATPVNVVQEDDAANSAGDDDEGRQLLQIIYGLAPKAKFCFATTSATEAAVAASITALASPTGSCRANIIMLDATYSDEPYFSDGVISLAAAQAVASGVSFFGTGSNYGTGLYDGTFIPTSDAAARAATHTPNLDLSKIPDAESAGGFQTFSVNVGGVPASSIAFGLTVPAQFRDTLALEWDDPADPTKNTEEYSFYVYNSNGTLNTSANGDFSDPEYGIVPGYPFLTVSLFSGSTPKTFYVVVTAKTTTSASPARHLRLFDFSQSPRVSTLAGTGTANVPDAYGSSTAVGANSVGTYNYTDLGTPESYSGVGPFTDVFDSNNNRLPSPITRLKPSISSVDCLDVTFSLFVYDTDGDGLDNFCGGSAAEASAAGVAALVLQAAGGNATPAQISAWLQQSASSANQWNPMSGYGLINAQKAVRLATGGTLANAATTTSLTASQNPAGTGSPLTLTVTVNSSGARPVGNVVFNDGRFGIKTVPVDAMGTATLTTSKLTAGTHQLTAVYLGDADTAASTSALLTEVVGSAVTAPTLALGASFTSVPLAAPVTFTAKVTNSSTSNAMPTGTVTFSDGLTAIATVNLVTGIASYTTSSLSAGVHVIAAQYNGDATDSPVGATLSETVSAGGATATTTALASAANPAAAGSSVMLTATVTSSGQMPTGTVNLYDGGIFSAIGTLTNGVASFATPAYTPGTHSLTAIYSGDSNSSTSVSNAFSEVIVSGTAPAITFGPASSTTFSGAPLGPFLTATSSAAGAFTYTATPTAGSPATVTAATVLPPGTYTITASFTPTDVYTYMPATASVSLTVAVEHIWILNSNGTLSELNDDGSPLAGSGASGAGIGLAVGSGGSLWSIGASGNTLTNFNTAGTFTATYSNGGLNAATALAIDGNGYVWVANGNNSVSQFTSAGAPVSGSGGYVGGGLSAPTGIAIDISGNVWISNAGNNSFTEILGAAAPAAPLAIDVKNGTPGVKP